MIRGFGGRGETGPHKPFLSVLSHSLDARGTTHGARLFGERIRDARLWLLGLQWSDSTGLDLRLEIYADKA
jgi:hypothetical protein